MRNTFREGIQSLFVIQTPFQALCAINAIVQFHIEEYKLVLFLSGSEKKRDDQTLEILRKYKIKFQAISNFKVKWSYRICMFFKKQGLYQRAFLGDFRFQDGLCYCLTKISHNGSIILMDDGNATITLLKNGYKPSGRAILSFSYYRFFAKLRNVSLNNLYTVYNGIESHDFNIKVNDLSYFSSINESGSLKGIIFVGTNNGEYLKILKMKDDEFKKMLEDIFESVRTKYPGEQLIYIPHGRDKTNYAKECCEQSGVKYIMPNHCVEVFLLDQPYPPLAVYGFFASSALFNIKKIFPNTLVRNISLSDMNLICNDNVSICNYYEQQGIEILIYNSSFASKI